MPARPGLIERLGLRTAVIDSLVIGDTIVFCPCRERLVLAPFDAVSKLPQTPEYQQTFCLQVDTIRDFDDQNGVVLADGQRHVLEGVAIDNVETKYVLHVAAPGGDTVCLYRTGPRPAGPDFCEHDPDLPLAKAELSKRRKDFAVRIDRTCRDVLSVGGAIGMAKASALGARLDDELAAVGGSMVRRAHGQQVLGLVAAALGAGLEVMNVDEDRVGAAGHGTAVPVASENGAAEGWGDVLPGSRGRWSRLRG